MSTSIDYLGKGLTVERYDELANLAVKKEWQKMELQLFRTKWFDYRFMHPSEATYLYAYHWDRIYRRFYAMNVDKQKSQVVKPLKGSNIFKDTKNISGLWRGRQHADAIGMPYDVYISVAFRENLRYWNRDHLPRPQQFYSARVVEAAQLAWPQHQESNLLISTLPAYHNDNYADTHEQNAHHEWLLVQASKRKDPAWVLQKLAGEGLLPMSKIVARFGDDMPEKMRIAA